MPDTRDWDIIEAIYDEEIGAGDFTSDYPKEQVERVRKAVMITDEQWDKLVADGRIKQEELETEKAAGGGHRRNSRLGPHRDDPAFERQAPGD